MIMGLIKWQYHSFSMLFFFFCLFKSDIVALYLPHCGLIYQCQKQGLKVAYPLYQIKVVIIKTKFTEECRHAKWTVT